MRLGDGPQVHARSREFTLERTRGEKATLFPDHNGERSHSRFRPHFSRLNYRINKQYKLYGYSLAEKLKLTILPRSANQILFLKPPLHPALFAKSSERATTSAQIVLKKYGDVETREADFSRAFFVWIFSVFSKCRDRREPEPVRRRNHDLMTGSRALQTESARSRSPRVGGDDRRADVAGAVRLGDGKRAGASRDAHPASGDGTDARARVCGAESRRSFAASRVCDDATRRDAIPDATPPRA